MLADELEDKKIRMECLQMAIKANSHLAMNSVNAVSESLSTGSILQVAQGYYDFVVSKDNKSPQPLKIVKR